MNERTTITQLPTPADGGVAADSLAREAYGPVLPDDNPFAADSLFDRTDAETTFPAGEPFGSTDSAGFSNPFPPQRFEPDETPSQPLPTAAETAAPQSSETGMQPAAETAVTDRSHDYPFRVYCTPESLSLFEHPRFPAMLHTTRPVPYRTVAADEIFGPESILVQPDADAAAEPPAADNALFQGFVLTLAVIYLLLIYHNVLEIHTLLNHVFHDPSSNERRFESTGSSRYSRFVRTTILIGILFVGILVVKYSRPLLPDALSEGFAFAAQFATSLAVSAVMLLLIGFQWLLLRLAGALTLTQPLLTQLRQLRKLYFSAAVVLSAPSLLLLTLSPAYTSKVWLGLTVIAWAITLFLYLRETLYLFLAKNVSILHWILYLCIVELFPVSLLWQLAVR